MAKYVFLTNEAANKGYSTSVKALASMVSNPTIIDAMEMGFSTFDEDVTLVSAGRMGFDLLKKYGIGNPMILATDRYGYENLQDLHCSRLTLIAPQWVLDKYRIAGVVSKVVLLPADLPAAPDIKTMCDYAGDFAQGNNVTVCNTILGCFPSVYFFFGGRVADPTESDPDHWKENTVEQFLTTADLAMTKAAGRDIYVVFHGLRSCTCSDKSNDFGPQNAAIDVLRCRRIPKQTVLVLATTEQGPTFIIMDEMGEGHIKVNNANASGYYMALYVAANNNADVIFTGEQMNLISEARALGINWTKLIPVCSEDGWNLTVDANEMTHRYVRDMLRRGETPLTQAQAFASVING